MTKILIVEDEKAIAELLCMSMQNAGYESNYVTDGEQGADEVEKTDYDLVLLDVMMPKVDGYELMEYIEPLKIPVIFITAKGSTKDKIKGLRMGADDYIVKPFEMDEVLARVDAVLRRYGKGQNLIKIKDVEIFTDSRKVIRGGKEVALTMKEYELLMVLVRNRNIVLYREDIFEKVWESEYIGDTRTVDLHIQRLRKKLDWKDLITTVYKMGYRLDWSAK